MSRIELGSRSPTIGTLEDVCRALGANLDIRLRWNGESLDRLLDAAHATIVDRSVAVLAAVGWEVAVEVTFSEYGERGSIDVLAWHSATRSLLVVEVKSVIADAQGTLMPLDRKTRLAVKVGRDRGWGAATISKVLVVRDGSTNRRRVDDLAATFDSAFALRGKAFRQWLQAPAGSISALVFLPDARQKSTQRIKTARERVNRPRRTVRASQ